MSLVELTTAPERCGESFNSRQSHDDIEHIMTMETRRRRRHDEASDAQEFAGHEHRWRISDVLIRRKWPILLTVIFVVLGMSFMFGWNPLVHHSSSWATGGDLWGIYRGAHYVGWGDLGGIYTQGTGIIAFPGMSVLLAPVAMITGHLHLTESYGPYLLPRPTAALVLMPVELLLASSVIFSSDALAERLNMTKRRRIWLCAMVATVAWPTTAVWGHAEDALAMTFALYAMVALLNGKWATTGWLFGFGIVTQPLVALMLPLLIGATPQGKRMLLAVRSAAISAVLVALALAGNAGDTYRSLVKQPTPPSINHATPWSALSPRLNLDTLHTVHYSSLVPGLGHPAVVAATARGREVVEVAGGPGRMLDVLLALLVGFWVWRRPQPPERILWLAAGVLASRCFFEPVMTPYYLAPPLFLGLIMAARQGGKRFAAASVLAAEVTVFSYHHLNPWVWWLPVVAGLIGIVAVGYPSDLVSELGPSVETFDVLSGPITDDTMDEQTELKRSSHPAVLLQGLGRERPNARV